MRPFRTPSLNRRPLSLLSFLGWRSSPGCAAASQPEEALPPTERPTLESPIDPIERPRDVPLDAADGEAGTVCDLLVGKSVDAVRQECFAIRGRKGRDGLIEAPKISGSPDGGTGGLLGGDMPARHPSGTSGETAPLTSPLRRGAFPTNRKSYPTTEARAALADQESIRPTMSINPSRGHMSAHGTERTFSTQKRA